jgi:hypothetical protein
MLDKKRGKYKPSQKNEQKLKKYINGKSESKRLDSTSRTTCE